MQKEVHGRIGNFTVRNFLFPAHLKVHFVAVFVVGLVSHPHELAPHPTRRARPNRREIKLYVVSAPRTSEVIAFAATRKGKEANRFESKLLLQWRYSRSLTRNRYNGSAVQATSVFKYHVVTWRELPG